MDGINGELLELFVREGRCGRVFGLLFGPGCVGAPLAAPESAHGFNAIVATVVWF